MYECVHAMSYGVMACRMVLWRMAYSIRARCITELASYCLYATQRDTLNSKGVPGTYSNPDTRNSKGVPGTYSTTGHPEQQGGARDLFYPGTP